MLALKIIPLFIVGIADIIFSFLVLLRDSRKINNLSFFGLAFSMGGWSLGIAGFMLTKSPNIAFDWAKLYYFFPLVIALSLIIFTLTFPTKPLPRPAFYGALAGFIGLALPLVLVRSFVTSKLVYHSWGKQIVLNNKDYLLYGIYLLVCFSVSLLLMYRKGKLKSGLYATQALFFFIGFLFAAVFGVSFNLVLPGFGDYRLIWIGPLFTGAFIAAIAYSIVRHKMFDIKLVLARSLSYITSIALLSAIYGFLVFGVAGLLFRLHLNVQTQLYLSITTGMVGLSFSRLRKVFDKLTNRLFYRDAYEPQELFDNLNKILVSTVDLDRLLKKTTSLLAESLKAEYCVVGLKEGDSQNNRIVGTQSVNFSAEDITTTRRVTPLMRKSVIATDYLEVDNSVLKSVLERNNISVLVRLSSNIKKTEEGLGYLVLGPKKSGNPYSNQDFRVLDTLAKELIIAIQNALRFEEIENFATTLQTRVDGATRKLRRTNEKLKDLDETKDDFISMASHQLRTPLTSIKGYISMVMEGDAGKITPMQHEMLGQAFFSSQRMVYLIADLLNISRLKTGKFVIEPTKTNLANMVQQELEQLEETAASRSLTLQYDKPDDFPDLMLDETKTRQVIMNFVDNAIYYTPAGGHITVRLLDNPHTIELRVEDTGIGVPKSEQHHLFTKFYRAGNARKARPDGTGLGLFMAKKVIAAQNGAVIFESQEGKGSTFGFSMGKSPACGLQNG